MKTSLFLGTALSALLVTGIAAADTKNFHAEADSENEHDPSSSAAITAVGDFTIDTVANTLCGKIVLTPTTAPLTQVHIHTGAQTDNGDILITLPSTYSTTTPGEIDVNFTNILPADITTIANDATYLNLHTEAFPSGAARGQLDQSDTVTPCIGTAVDYQNPTGTADAGADSGATTSTSSSSSSSGATDTDAGATTSAGDTSDSSGCSTSGSSSDMGTVGFLAGLGLVVAAVSRKKKKA